MIMGCEHLLMLKRINKRHRIEEIHTWINDSKFRHSRINSTKKENLKRHISTYLPIITRMNLS